MSLVLTGSGVTYPNGQTQTTPFPIGMVCHFANVTAPDGWLECNGAAVSRTTYAALFAAIGTVYGAGNGSTTFNLPDLRGQFLRGWDNGRGVDSGRAIGSNQTDDVKAHTHGYNTIGYAQLIGYGTQGNGNLPVPSAATTNSTGTETRPVNVAMMPCIKT